MTHGGNSKGIIMRRPDGTPMSRSEVIVQRRGALKWMPVLFSNDLVHGSWWFVVGSAVTMLFSMYPLIQKYSGNYEHNDDILPATDYDVTWALMIISGFFFTLGSLAFVRAFEEPPQRPLFYNHKHFQTDELLGAWFFLFGTAPAIPYMFLFFIFEPSAFFFFGLVAAIVFTYATYLFVAACYPSDKVHKNYVLPMMIRLLGPQLWIVKHLANDWLAGTWFFLWANAIAAFVSVIILFISFALGDAAQIFIWLSGTVSSVLFLFGSAYFVSGSYPHAQQFYYAEGRGHIERDPAFMDINPNDGDEETADTARLLPEKPVIAKKPLKSATNDVPTEAKRGHDTPRDNKPAPSKPADKPSDKPDRPEKPTASSAIDSDKKNLKGSSSGPSQDHSDRKKIVKSPPVTPARNAKSASSSSAPEPGPMTTTQTTAASNSGKDASEDLLPPPPPPVLPPPVVPDENQDDDDDDVDASEENSAMLFKTGASVNAADLVQRQLFRKRSLALDKRGNEDDLLGIAAETSPEKADNSNNNDDLLSGIEGVSDFVTVVADADDGTAEIANNNSNNNTSAASKQSKPPKKAKKRPPPAPTL